MELCRSQEAIDFEESDDEPVPSDIKIEVTAQDGKTVETYELHVTEAAPNTDATLKDLTISAGTLDPDFAADTTDYKADVPKGAVTTIVAVDAICNQP